MNPPPGAFVFYSGTADHPRDYSHVTLSLGNGQAISTADSVQVANNDKIHVEPIARPGRYLGWWLPAS
jgi:cell wall-associated NlpC family hydrolase